MDRPYYKTPKSGWLMRLFWKAAGADRYILEKSTYSDHIKYACLGGIVVATGFMAALAGGYAFYIIFEPKGSALEMGTDPATAIKAIFFGLIWGLIIFNIDRFIVTSTGKGDGTEAITKQEIRSAIPRIVMGVIIAITISKPVEIRMFKSEIDAELHSKQLEKEKEDEEKVRSNYQELFESVENDLASIEEKRNDLIEKIEEYDQRYQKEVSGGQGVRVKGEGPVAKTLKEERKRWEKRLKRFDKEHDEEISSLKRRKKELIQQQDKELAQNKTVAAGLDGLLERIKIAHEIAGFWITLFITLLFMAIELTPIFFKMMLIKSPYDYIDENIKELIKGEQGIEVQYDYYKDKDGQERNLVIHHQAEKLLKEKIKLLKTQSELSDFIIDKWKEKEKKDIESNPENFISGKNDIS